MRIILSILIFLCCGMLKAQIPPAIQWQKAFGGSDVDGFTSIIPTPDGGFIFAGSTLSTDGDITRNYGYLDAWIIKTNGAGAIQWQRTYGGSLSEGISDIKNTTDGGYIFSAATNSNDGDVSGNHGGIFDVWIVKLSSSGIIQWQKCYGGPGKDFANSIELTSDGGYIIGAGSDMNGGDVSGHHGPTTTNDLWILKIDITGNLQWQNCYGGTGTDDISKIFQAADGGYIISATLMSRDGDISCPIIFQDIWVAKLNNTGIIQWQNCLGLGHVGGLAATQDGGFVLAGTLFGVLGDAAITKFSATGTLQWQRLVGGSNEDYASSIIQLADGSYIAAGETKSSDGNICSVKGGKDFFVVKLNSDGALAWNKTLGGLLDESANAIIQPTDGGFLLGGYSRSNDGDVIGNHGLVDGWIVKLGFPGVPVLPAITISANDAVICPGQNVIFSAATTNEGTAPLFQWKINGINTGLNNDTLISSALNNGDIISCEITSNSPCITSPTAISNTIRMTIDPTFVNGSFLPASTELCAKGILELKPTGTFKTYLWNTNSVSPSITIDQPGIYWLEVISNDDCPGKDTVVVTLKECLTGFFMPTAFSPNNDGLNDILKPTIGNKTVAKFNLAIYDRWGQIVFQSTDPGKGWNGKIKGTISGSHVFIWVCSYQFAGEDERTEKGSLLLIR